MSTTLHLSLAEYDQMVRVGAFDHLQRKVELIHGEIVAMNPAGPLHDYLVTCLITWSMQHLDPSIMMVSSQTGLNLPDQISRPEPDVMWLRVGNYRSSHPRANDVYLAIEVAHSSLVYDLEEKRKLYASAGIAEYWIVDGLANCVHVFRSPDAGDYTRRQVYKAGETLAPQISPHAQLDLTQLFADN
jgi:Uma2 family endonuclease